MASLLKLYLRELPEPVIPFAKYEDFLSCGQLLSKDEGEVSDPSNLPPSTWKVVVPKTQRSAALFSSLFSPGLSQWSSWEPYPEFSWSCELGFNITGSCFKQELFWSQSCSLVLLFFWTKLFCSIISKRCKVGHLGSFPSLAVDSLASCMKSLPFSVFSVSYIRTACSASQSFGGWDVDQCDALCIS